MSPPGWQNSETYRGEGKPVPPGHAGDCTAGPFALGGSLCYSAGWVERFARAVGAFHQSYDIYLTPTTAMGPAEIGSLETPAFQQNLVKIMVALRGGKLLLKSGMVDKMAFDNLDARRSPSSPI